MLGIIDCQNMPVLSYDTAMFANVSQASKLNNFIRVSPATQGSFAFNQV